MTEKEKQELVLTRMMDNDTLHALKTSGILREETEIDLETLFARMKQILLQKDTTMSQLFKILWEMA